MNIWSSRCTWKNSKPRLSTQRRWRAKLVCVRQVRGAEDRDYSRRFRQRRTQKNAGALGTVTCILGRALRRDCVAFVPKRESPVAVSNPVTVANRGTPGAQTILFPASHERRTPIPLCATGKGPRNAGAKDDCVMTLIPSCFIPIMHRCT